MKISDQGSADQTLRNAIIEHTLYMVVIEGPLALMSMLHTPCSRAATENTMSTGASKYTINQ